MPTTFGCVLHRAWDRAGFLKGVKPCEEHTVNDRAADIPLDRSRSVEAAIRELTRMALTEACVSGLCDFCLAQETCFGNSESLGMRRWDLPGIENK